MKYSAYRMQTTQKEVNAIKSVKILLFHRSYKLKQCTFYILGIFLFTLYLNIAFTHGVTF